MIKKMLTIPVDIYNQFCYNDSIFQIDENLRQYKVKKSSDGNEDWENEATMDSIIVVDDDEVLKFLDQNNKDISKYVKLV